MARDAPTAVLQAAFRRLVDAHADAPPAASSAAAFIATRGFQGRKPGYYFGNGAQGIGCAPCNDHARAVAQPQPRLARAREARRGLCSARRYYPDARQPQPAAPADAPPAEEAKPDKPAPQPVDADALLREAEEQAGAQARRRGARSALGAPLLCTALVLVRARSPQRLGCPRHAGLLAGAAVRGVLTSLGSVQAQLLDARGLKRLVLAFEKKARPRPAASCRAPASRTRASGTCVRQ